MAVVREFDGERFYLKKSGHYRNPNSCLHRRVWEKHNGPIPKGMVIHHIDHDPANNEIENLELMSWSEHTRQHMNEPESIERQRASWEKKRAIGDIVDVPFRCEQCGEDGLGPRKSFHSGALKKRFCSKKCARRAYYLRCRA